MRTGAAVHLELGDVAAVEVHRDHALARRIEVAADRGDEPRDVHRAARAGVPVPAPVRAVALELVLVEIVLAVARQPRQRAVVERELEPVGVLAVELEVQHPLRPEDHRDRGAGLGIGGVVRQVVVGGEALVRRRGAEAAGHVHPRRGHVAPEHLAGALERVVAELGREVGHGRVHVHRPHRVADDLVLLAHGLVRLAVLVGALPVLARRLAAGVALDVEIVRLPAALVDEVGGEVELLLLAGQVVELDQRDLDLLVAADSRASAPARCRRWRGCGRGSAPSRRASCAGRSPGSRRSRPRACGRSCRARGCRAGWSSGCRSRARCTRGSGSRRGAAPSRASSTMSSICASILASRRWRSA